MNSMVVSEMVDEQELLEKAFVSAMLYKAQPAPSTLMIPETAQQMVGGVLSQIFNETETTARAAAQVVFEMESDGYRYTISRSKINTTRLHLSPREQEIVRLIAQGLPNKTIAAVLDISQHTVATYIKRLFSKLDVCSRAQMIARVMDQGI